MKKSVAVASVALVGLLFGFWYFSGWGSPSKISPRAAGTVIAFGDSLTEGTGASPGNDYPAILSRKFNIQIVNAGRAGDTTTVALDRLDRDVLAKDPRLVMVFLGGNDILRQIPKATTFENLRAILGKLQKKGAAVLLIGFEQGRPLDSYGRAFADLAKEKNVEFIPDILGGVYGHPELMSDELHPNDKGYAMIANRIEPVLRSMLRSAKSQ